MGTYLGNLSCLVVVVVVEFAFLQERRWDIMRCESEPLPSQYQLKNCPQSILLNTLLYFLYILHHLAPDYDPSPINEETRYIPPSYHPTHIAKI